MCPYYSNVCFILESFKKKGRISPPFPFTVL